MLLTHPLTHMGRVWMLAAHLCALLLHTASCRACLHDVKQISEHSDKPKKIELGYESESVVGLTT